MLYGHLADTLRGLVLWPLLSVGRGESYRPETLGGFDSNFFAFGGGFVEDCALDETELFAVKLALVNGEEFGAFFPGSSGIDPVGGGVGGEEEEPFGAGLGRELAGGAAGVFVIAVLDFEDILVVEREQVVGLGILDRGEEFGAESLFVGVVAAVGAAEEDDFSAVGFRCLLLLGAADFSILFGVGEEPGVVAFVAVGDDDEGDRGSGLVEFEQGAGDEELGVIGVADDYGDPGSFLEEVL